jgi:hypothetical protein
VNIIHNFEILYCFTSDVRVVFVYGGRFNHAKFHGFRNVLCISIRTRTGSPASTVCTSRPIAFMSISEKALPKNWGAHKLDVQRGSLEGSTEATIPILSRGAKSRSLRKIPRETGNLWLGTGC